MYTLYTHICICIYTSIHIHTYMYTYKHMYTDTHMHTEIHTYLERVYKEHILYQKKSFKAMRREIHYKHLNYQTLLVLFLYYHLMLYQSPVISPISYFRFSCLALLRPLEICFPHGHSPCCLLC